MSVLASACDARVSAHGARCASGTSTQRSCSQRKFLAPVARGCFRRMYVVTDGKPTPVGVLAQEQTALTARG
eukprot:2357856-Alexandrium_andersonii.AAC.1